MKRLKPILRGIKSYLPFFSSFRGTGGTNSARYCYSVWLRHLCVTYKNGLPSYPHTIAELGPGDSIGIGLAWLIGGAQRYYALDIVGHATNEHNMEIFDELVTLVKNRENIPDEDEFPRVYPRLESYAFLSNILTEHTLKESLNEQRITKLRKYLSNINGRGTDSPLQYICPWFSEEIINEGSVDMIFSQAVLEHIDDLEHTYEALYRWLRKGGMMSHLIDFKSHRITDEWNGHWSYSDFSWRIIRGNRPYLLNREPLSTHIKYLEMTGFKVVCIIPVKGIGGLKRNKLARRYRNLSDEDLTTCIAHLISIKE